MACPCQSFHAYGWAVPGERSTTIGEKASLNLRLSYEGHDMFHCRRRWAHPQESGGDHAATPPPRRSMRRTGWDGAGPRAHPTRLSFSSQRDTHADMWNRRSILRRQRMRIFYVVASAASALTAFGAPHNGGECDITHEKHAGR
jgi:hypothetical protein